MKKTIGKITIEEIMADVAKEIEDIAHPKPHWFTAQQFMESTKAASSLSTTRRRLNGLVAAGKLRKHTMLDAAYYEKV